MVNGCLISRVGPIPDAPEKIEQTPHHLMAQAGLVTDEMGAELPVVNLYLTQKIDGDETETPEQRRERADRRYMVLVQHIPVLVKFIQDQGAASLHAADPGPPLGRA